MEGGCETLNSGKGRIANAAFKKADVGPIESAFERKPFLRKSSLLAEPSNPYFSPAFWDRLRGR